MSILQKEERVRERVREKERERERERFVVSLLRKLILMIFPQT